MKKLIKPFLGLFICIFLIFALGFLLDFASREISRQIYPQKYADIVDECAEKYSLPPELIFAVIKTESSFDPNAKSHAGACGLMQITPRTFAWISSLRSLSTDPDMIFDERTNIDYGCYLLRYLYDRYESFDTAFAAYNAGMTRVNEWLGDESISKDGVLLNIPFEETRNYIKKVNHAIDMYKLLYE